MKKRTKYIIIAAAVLGVAAAVFGGIFAWKIHKKNALIEQQNYVASKLLELGEYEEGRILSAQTEQMEANAVSERLLVLAAGFQTDYEVGVIYADKYLEQGEDKIISSAKKIYEETLKAAEEETDLSAFYVDKAEEARQKLLPLLLQVQNSLSVGKNDERILAVVDMMSGKGSAATMAILEEDDSLLSQRAQVAYAVQTGDYEKAYEKAEDLYLESGTFENRSRLANLSVARGTNATEDEKTEQLQERQAQLKEDLRELEQQYAQETLNSKKNKFTQRIEDLQREISELEQEINAIPALKAINFMETTTPIKERDTVAYKIEIAQLYYKAGRSEEAREYLTEIIREDRMEADPVSLMFADFLRAYTDNDLQANSSYMSTERNDVKVLWNRLAQLLGFVENTYQYDGNPFFDFVRKLLDQLYNGLIIRSIDATDFPTVRVTVNVAMETGRTLEKQDFSLVEMGEDIKEFELLDIQELKDTQTMSVVLVVDHSGSMSGSAMVDTKQAVTNFVKNIDETIGVGLVIFDDSAQLIEPVSENKRGVLQGIANVQAAGGTNIYSGLKLAGEALESRVGRRVVILISDGGDGNAAMIDEVLGELMRKQIYVYTIGFGGADTEYLSYIARKCGGKFIQADSSSMLGEIYASVGEYMVNDYVIEFNVLTELEKFTRTVKVLTELNDAFAEREYHVGVSYDEIEAEQNKPPLADYFQQVGGSAMEIE